MLSLICFLIGTAAALRVSVNVAEPEYQLVVLNESFDAGSSDAAHRESDMGATGVSGRERADSLNTCGRAKKWDAALQNSGATSRVLHAAYALNGKAASSTIRDLIRDSPKAPKCDNVCKSNLTWFTFVRDPLERSISGFMEIHSRGVCNKKSEYYVGYGTKLPTPNQTHAQELPRFCKFGIDPYNAKPGQAGLVLRRFQAVIADMENNHFTDAHLVQQHNHTYAVFPVSFIGTIANFKNDWKALGNIQAYKFKAKWPNVELHHVRQTPDSVYARFNVSNVPDVLAKRVCKFYRDDYCCHKLPFPPQCRGMSC